MPNYKPIPKLTTKIIDHFWSKVDIRGLNDCWPWLASCAYNGYGLFFINRRLYRAPRVALATVGKRSNILDVLHDPIICNTPGCVNPRHLRFGTQADNGQDTALAGSLKGVKNKAAKLIDTDIPIIRKLSETLSQQKIADFFNVKQPAISRIILGQTWAHIAGVASYSEVASIFSNLPVKKNNYHRLTETDILLIRKFAETVSKRQVSKIFNVSPTMVGHIVLNRQWTHVVGIATDSQAKAYLKKNNLTLP